MPVVRQKSQTFNKKEEQSKGKISEEIGEIYTDNQDEINALAEKIFKQIWAREQENIIAKLQEHKEKCFGSSTEKKLALAKTKAEKANRKMVELIIQNNIDKGLKPDNGLPLIITKEKLVEILKQ